LVFCVAKQRGPLVTKLPAGLLCYREIRPLLYFINFVDRQSREICFKLTKLGSSSLPTSLATKLIGFFCFCNEVTRYPTSLG